MVGAADEVIRKARDMDLVSRLRAKADEQEQIKLSAGVDTAALLREAADALVTLVEDRARFPDKPDMVGRMIGAQFGNLKLAKEQSERYALQWHNEACKVYELLRECVPALELSHSMKRGGPAKSDALAILNRVRAALAD